MGIQTRTVRSVCMVTVHSFGAVEKSHPSQSYDVGGEADSVTMVPSSKSWLQSGSQEIPPGSLVTSAGAETSTVSRKGGFSQPVELPGSPGEAPPAWPG